MSSGLSTKSLCINLLAHCSTRTLMQGVWDAKKNFFSPYFSTQTCEGSVRLSRLGLLCSSRLVAVDDRVEDLMLTYKKKKKRIKINSRPSSFTLRVFSLSTQSTWLLQRFSSLLCLAASSHLPSLWTCPKLFYSTLCFFSLLLPLHCE